MCFFKKVYKTILILVLFFASLFNTVYAWDLSTLSYDSVNFNINEPSGSVTGIRFKPDGTKLYYIATNERVYQMSLSTAWDITSATSDGVDISVAPVGVAMDLVFKPDGSKMYVSDYDLDRVYQFSLSTAWDLSTASYDSIYKSVQTEETALQATTFSNDGTKMYIVGRDQDTVFEYDLSTAWDITSASKNSNELVVSGEDKTPMAIFFRPNGEVLYMAGQDNDEVHQYTLSTPWDISTASGAVSGTVGDSTAFVSNMDIKPDGTKIFVSGTNDYVDQYSMTPPDETAPVISGGSPSGEIDRGELVTLQVTTDENATCKYDTVADTAYASMTYTFNTTGGTSHSSALDISNTGEYFYYVRCQDGSFNLNTSDYVITFELVSSGGRKFILNKEPSSPSFYLYNNGGNVVLRLSYYHDYVYTDTLNVEYFKKNDESEIKKIKNNSGLSLSWTRVVEDLECDTEYTFRAYAENSIGKSEVFEDSIKTSECMEDNISFDENLDKEGVIKQIEQKIQELMIQLISLLRGKLSA